jgi:hypothetical protein
MDLLGHLRQETGNQKAAHRSGTQGTEGRNAPTLLLARLSSPLKITQSGKLRPWGRLRSLGNSGNASCGPGIAAPVSNLCWMMRNRFPEKLLCLLLFLLAFSDGPVAQTPATQTPDPARSKTFTQQLVAAAIERTHHVVRYDPAYVRIPYPNGDVPADTGVCTDEIIRIYRAVGIDLQKEVHEDMQENFSNYPHQARWRLTNIDHRRVPNLIAH